jgi:uncharacterized LabA/DUF88 family protein
MERTAIFIDGGYLKKLLEREFNGARIDMARLVVKFAADTDLLRSYYYDCPPYQSNPPTDEERSRVASRDRFFTALQRLSRFQVRLGKLAYRGVDSKGEPIFDQKRVDIMIGVDMVQLAATRQITRAVLLAGDSDFVPAVDAVKQHGVLVVLWHGPLRRGRNGTVHQELWDSCDERFEITPELIREVRRERDRD